MRMDLCVTQELPITIPELATMGPSWAPDGTEVVGSSSLTLGKSGDDSPKAGSALGEASAVASDQDRATEC